LIPITKNPKTRYTKNTHCICLYKTENVKSIEELERKIESLEIENSSMTTRLVKFDKDKSSLERDLKKMQEKKMQS